jgi:hypothetical protein
MTEGTNRVPITKSWADEIDDLHLDATEKHLRAVFFTRARKRLANSEGADEHLPGGGSNQHESPSGSIPL